MHRRKNTVLKIIIAVLICIILGTLLFIVLKTINDNRSMENYNNIASSAAGELLNSGGEDGSNDSTSPSIDTKAQKNPIDFDSLYKQNSDIYSWIYIPGTNVNYPVCQSSVNDNFYLDHDIDKNYKYSGSIYSQSCNKIDYSDRVTVLYGHNMANGSMFATLHRFRDEDFFDSHKYIYIYTENRKLTYEIVSAFEYDDRHIINSFDFSNDEVFADYLEMIMNPRSLSANVREGIELNIDDKILVLSTCLNSGEGRYLVQGVLVKDEQTK